MKQVATKAEATYFLLVSFLAYSSIRTCYLFHAGFLLGIFFDTEDKADMLF
jgi:hypothetical protein